MDFIWVFLGAGLGGAARHGVNLLAARLGLGGFPVATLAINVAGSALMGAFAALFALRLGAPQGLRLFLTTGVLGGFTTFSAFSLDALSLLERARPWSAAAYAALSVGLSLAAVAGGAAATRLALRA